MTDSYVPTLNADGDIQNVATQQSERGGKTIETQEFALTAAQLTTITPPANPDPSTETKQDTLITAIGTLQTTVEALTTAVGLLAKLTDTQPVDAGYSKVSTLNSGSGTFSGTNDGGTPIFEGTLENMSDYSSVIVSATIPDAGTTTVAVKYSNNSTTTLDDFQEQYIWPNGMCTFEFPVKAHYCYVQINSIVEGVGSHTYNIETIERKNGFNVYPRGLNANGSMVGLYFDGDGNLAVKLSDEAITLLQTIADNTTPA